jgi:hypothetical protein
MNSGCDQREEEEATDRRCEGCSGREGCGLGMKRIQPLRVHEQRKDRQGRRGSEAYGEEAVDGRPEATSCDA